MEFDRPLQTDDTLSAAWEMNSWQIELCDQIDPKDQGHKSSTHSSAIKAQGDVIS